MNTFKFEVNLFYFRVWFPLIKILYFTQNKFQFNGKEEGIFQKSFKIINFLIDLFCELTEYF